MYKSLLKYILIPIFIILYYLEFYLLIDKSNSSLISGFKVIFILFLVIIFIGSLISKIIFRFRIHKKINIENFTLNNLFKSILFSCITLLILFSVYYISLYYYGYKILSIFINSNGIINSTIFLIKIYLISLPIYAFEITYLEYCNFIKSIEHPLLLLILKSISILILTGILTILFGINGFLYSKNAIDILVFPYYIIKLRKIIKLTKERTNQ